MRRSGTKRLFLFVLGMMLCAGLLAGCGREEEQSAAKEEPAEVTEAAGREAEEIPEAKAEEEGNQENPAEGSFPTQKSLSERLCGKYSCHIPGGESGEDDIGTLQLVSFGDNLYAFCALARQEEDTESPDAYSFWAAEFIPDDASALKSTDSQEAEVTALEFSIMSNLGQYWDSGVKGTIRLTDEGLELTGFDNDGFLVPEHEASRSFVRDERIEDGFVYLKETGGKPVGAPEGLWVFEGEEEPVFLLFEGDNLFIYQKSPEKEVYYAGGGCEFRGNSFLCRANILGSGGMPDEWKGEYQRDGERLKLTLEGETLPGGLSGEVMLRRVENKDIPVITMDEVRFREDSFGYYSGGAGAYEYMAEDGFTGIWTGAHRDRDAAVTEAKKLHDMGYESCVCYSPEWEGLNSEEYYCVSTGKYRTEEEAKEELPGVKAAGFPDAYLKFSGKRKFVTVSYTNSGDVKTEVYSRKVILKDVPLSITRAWDPQMESAEGSLRSDLIIDEDTVFDETCDLSFFGNYEEGETPLAWFSKNAELMENDTDRYLAEGPALSGVFEVGIRGSHIDRFFGSYWWD